MHCICFTVKHEVFLSDIICTSPYRGVSCDVTHVEFPGIEGQNTQGVSVFTSRAHDITIDTTVTQWARARQNQRDAQPCPSKSKRRAIT